MFIRIKWMKPQIFKVHLTNLIIHKHRIQGQRTDQTKIFNHWFIITARKNTLSMTDLIIIMVIAKEFKVLSTRLTNLSEKDQLKQLKLEW